MDSDECWLNDFVNKQINENLEMISNFKEKDFYIFQASILEEKLRASTRYLMEIQDILFKRRNNTP